MVRATGELTLGWRNFGIFLRGHARYELHRVWVVEGRLKEGHRHKYSRRVFHVDEDSWQVAAADNYDRGGNLWRVSEGHIINYYQVPAPWYTLRVYYDLIARRYLVNGLDFYVR